MKFTTEKWVQIVIPNKKIRLRLYVKPSSKTEKIEIEEHYISISINAAPEKGKANKEIIEILSKKLKINCSAFSIISGQKSRDKIIEIEFSENTKIDFQSMKKKLIEN